MKKSQGVREEISGRSYKGEDLKNDSDFKFPVLSGLFLIICQNRTISWENHNGDAKSLWVKNVGVFRRNLRKNPFFKDISKSHTRIFHMLYCQPEMCILLSFFPGIIESFGIPGFISGNFFYQSPPSLFVVCVYLG